MINTKKLIAKFLACMDDGGWKSISAYGGTVNYRKRHGVVYIEADSISVGTGTLTTICTLPVGYRPTRRHTDTTNFPVDLHAYINYTEAGEVQVVRSNQAISNLYFSTSYIAVD